MKRLVSCGALAADLVDGGNVEIYATHTPEVRFRIQAADLMDLQHLATALITPHFNPTFRKDKS
jgi:hypothetical protein